MTALAVVRTAEVWSLEIVDIRIAKKTFTVPVGRRRVRIWVPGEIS